VCWNLVQSHQEIRVYESVMLEESDLSVIRWLKYKYRDKASAILSLKLRVSVSALTSLIILTSVSEPVL